MNKLDFTLIELRNLVTHSVGNKLRDEKVRLSSQETRIGGETKDYLMKYFFSNAKSDEIFSFVHPLRIELNEVYCVIRDLFTSPQFFVEFSQQIAHLLYEQSLHPKIRSGMLNVAYFSGAIFGDEVVDAIGIFKSETGVPFLKMDSAQTCFSINHEIGFEIKGIDKGCIILNVDAESGYKAILTEANRKPTEARYWKDEFLRIGEIASEYRQTVNFLSIAREFASSKMHQGLEVSTTEEIDLLNRSLDYFKRNEKFSSSEFEEQVLIEEQLISSFREFNDDYKEENKIEFPEAFDISSKAVKKQERYLKRVLRLDANFQVHMFGGKEFVEKGIDADGRKYYKLFYDKEL